jgi:FKBP-type peptidyl-prolyl cis-trans isomerase SlyD
MAGQTGAGLRKGQGKNIRCYAVLRRLYPLQAFSVMSDTIQNEKFIELNYKIIDQQTGDVLVTVDYPLGYVHGVNDVLSEQVTKELDGKKIGDIIDVPVDTKLLYGERDESLVFTDHIENVPEEYREIGMTITMENDKGEPRNFIVTRFDDKTFTVDGNNPLCGREVVFRLEVLTIREATDEEIDLGGAVDADPDINEILSRT